MQEVTTLFRRHFGSPPAVIAAAPGRLELLGNHTDYNEGLVMSLAVDRRLYIAATPRGDGRIALVSSAFPERVLFPFNVLEKNPAAPWANHVKGVLSQLRRRGVNLSGFNAAIHSAIPPGAGLASSAALGVATAMVVRRLFPYTLTSTGTAAPPERDRQGRLPTLTMKEKLVLAQICRDAEAEFAGVNCGLLDQISSLCGRAEHVIEIDFMHQTVTHDPMAGGVAVVVCDSGVPHDLADGGYNELRGQCEGAVAALGLKSLRTVDARLLKAQRAKLTERQFNCARHIAGENARVVAGEKALRGGDVVQFGQFLFQSHESSRVLFKNSCPELDLLVDLARGLPGCLGARLTGGGFGGATLNLVEYSLALAFMRTIADQYEKQTGRALKPMICQAVDGAE